MQVVKVEWIDSCCDEGWKSRDVAGRHTCSNCTTVGYLFRKNRTQVSIVQSTSDTGQVSEIMAIPRRCIKKITRLE